MKQRKMILFVCILIGVLIALEVMYNQNKPYSFIADGEDFSAEVNGGEMRLQLWGGEWFVLSCPKSFRCEEASAYGENEARHTLLRFIALGEGNAYTTLQCIRPDGTVESRELGMQIVRRGSGLQIESVSLGTIAEEKNVLRAVIESIENGRMTVVPTAGSAELNSSDRFEVPMLHLPAAPEPQVGDTVDIVHNGCILETYPASFERVYSIQLAK